VSAFPGHPSWSAKADHLRLFSLRHASSCLQGRPAELSDTEIVPVRIHLLDQPGLPRPVPRLDPLLASDRGRDLAVMLREHEAREPVEFRESGKQLLPMFWRAPLQIRRHADIEDAVRPVGHDLHIAALDHELRAFGLGGDEMMEDKAWMVRLRGP